jgi:hypothetical protein
VATYPVIEHRAGRAGRWLRANRMRLAFGLAIVETALVVASVLQWRWAVLIAAIVFAFHLFVGRRARWETIRQLSWAAAVSQTLPVLVPFAFVVVGTLVVLAIVGAAFVVLVLFLLGRR